MDGQRKPAASSEEKPFRGLYKHVKISVRALDIIIVCCIALILLLVALELTDPGFTVTFDSNGGTDVAAQTQMYGELVDVPEPPTREGYVFAGWYADENCTIAWNMETDIVTDSIKLYAAWDKAT